MAKHTPYFDVVIVGAGAAGVGMGVVLSQLGVEKFTLVDRYDVGASFEAWPAEMRFITPSFPSNSFGSVDLNSIAPATSPAFTLRTEHPSGKEYAGYLKAVARHFRLPVMNGVDVREVRAESSRFRIESSRGPIEAAMVVWAAGEFQYPHLAPFPGAEHCLHNGLVTSWREITGDDLIVVGGYESGVDAAVNLTALGKRVRLLDARAAWNSESSEPSTSLAPYTARRLEGALCSGNLELIGPARVASVERIEEGYVLRGEKRRKWQTASRPILATGFRGSLSLVGDLFEWTPAGQPLVSQEADESTLYPGLFLSGPMVRHGSHLFCFIYKFRQRFAVVAQEIAARLGIDSTPLDAYRQAGMFLEDLSCCGAECVC